MPLTTAQNRTTGYSYQRLAETGSDAGDDQEMLCVVGGGEETGAQPQPSATQGSEQVHQLPPYAGYTCAPLQQTSSNVYT